MEPGTLELERNAPRIDVIKLEKWLYFRDGIYKIVIAEIVHQHVVCPH